MWIRLPLLAILGAAAFSYPIAKQVRTLTSTAEHWILLAAAFIGLLLFVYGIRKFPWRFGTRPLKIFSSLCLFACLAVGFAAIWWSHAWVGVAAGLLYFGLLIASGMTKTQWKVVRPYGSLLFLLASPIGVSNASLADDYKQLSLRCASALLDAFQVRNVLEGERLDGFSASTDWSQLATGFWSSSALLAVIALTMVWKQLRRIHGLMLLPLAVIIGMLMLIGRAAFIVGKNRAVWPTLVDLFSFLIAACLAWICLSLVRFLLDPIHGNFKSRFAPAWNRRTIVGLASIQLRSEANSQSEASTDSCRLPTIEAIENKQERAKKRSWLRRLARAIRRGLAQPFIFINDWCRSRSYRRLLALLPVIMICIAVYMEPTLQPQIAWSERELSERYVSDLQTALDEDDRSRMGLLTRRLLQFSSLPDPEKLSLVKALFLIDEEAEAETVLTPLTDAQVNSYAPAQLWRAKRVIANPAQLTVADQRRLKHWLRESLRDPMLAPEANSLLGKIFLQAGDDETALIHFRAITEPSPETSLMLSMIYKRRGDELAFLRCLRNAEAACQDLLLVPTESSQLVRLMLARSLQLQNRFSEAMKVLEESPGFADDPVAREAAIFVDIAWLESLPVDQEQGRQERIQHATKLDAKNLRLQKTLAGIAVEEANKQVQELREGTQTPENGTYEAAERPFRDAVAAGFESPLMLSNYAWLLAQRSDPSNTEEALGMINRALVMNPRLAESWKTRAGIFQQSGQNLAAIADLERAIQVGDQSPEVRRTLANLYELQGDQETAQRYRNQVPEKPSK